MILVGSRGRKPHPGLDALEFSLRRIPTPELSRRRAHDSSPGFHWCFTVPYLGFENAVADGRTIRRLERHTRPLENSRGPARVVVPRGVRPGYLVALAGAQGRMRLVFDVPEEIRKAALEFGLFLVARSPGGLEFGGYGLVEGEPSGWLGAARSFGGDVHLFGPPPVALELKRGLST